MKKKIKLGILGIGNIGTSHAKNILKGKCPEIELVAVADRNPERLEWARENTPDAARFDSAQAMFDSSLIDSVLVAVPHYDHPKYAIECMKRGLHVLVEKPAGVYTKQVRQMNEAAENSDVVFGMMFNQRTNHIYRKMHEIVSSGELGEIRRTNWIITDWYRSQIYYDSGAWRATWSGEGGGVLLNQCPHNLDLWQWICGMPKSVDAKLHFGKWHDIEVEDDVTAYVEYENGATGIFVTSTADTPGTNRFEITLDGGKLVAEDGKLFLWKLDIPEPEFNKTNEKPFGKPTAEFSEVETDGKSENHVGVMNAFAGAILHDTPLIADGKEGINSLTLSNAMHMSAWTGGTVTLPLNEDLFFEKLSEKIKHSRRKADTAAVVADTSDSYGS